MFYEFASQIWTTSGAGVVVTNNTDTSIDGSCKKVVWTSALNGYVNIAFTAVDLSSWEELSMWILMGEQIAEGNIFKITVDGTDYNFTRESLMRGWNHVLFDCSDMGSVSSIRITSLVSGLTLMIDYIGYRKVTYNADVDVITALKNHISLDYDVTTSLTANASAGASSISLASYQYVNDSSIVEIDNGSGTVETIEILGRNGTLATPLVNSFLAGSEVRVVCPVRGEDYDSVEPDPVCGVKVFDIEVDRDEVTEYTVNGLKTKEYLGSLGVIIYIDCSSKKKLLQMAREYNKKYGKEFQFLLDGEQVDIYLDSSLYADGELGNNPRMAYYYRIQPQANFSSKAVEITDFNFTVVSVGP